MLFEGGCVSTTGMFLVMQGQNGTFWPIHWYARRQKCVSRSATEAEAVALAEGTYEDALPSMFLALPVGLGGASTWQALSCGPEPDAGHDPSQRVHSTGSSYSSSGEGVLSKTEAPAKDTAFEHRCAL